MMEKYITCNFGYWDQINDRTVSLIYTGKARGMGSECQRCGKKIHGTAHFFTEVSMESESEEWVFGTECVKYVFGAGLK